VLNACEGTLISARSDRSARSFEAFFSVVFDVPLRRPKPAAAPTAAGADCAPRGEYGGPTPAPPA
jgi:hypothetical protein